MRLSVISLAKSKYIVGLEPSQCVYRAVVLLLTCYQHHPFSLAQVHGGKNFCNVPEMCNDTLNKCHPDVYFMYKTRIIIYFPCYTSSTVHGGVESVDKRGEKRSSTTNHTDERIYCNTSPYM